MTDTKAPDQGLALADDGQLHTTECVHQGWWRLDWDAECVTVGVPPGGEDGARQETALFSTSLILLSTGGVHGGR